MRPPTTRDAASIAFIALAYFAACRIAFFFPDAGRVLVSVWPAGGIGLAALLLSPRRRWPAICAALFVAGNAANFLIGRPLFNSLGFVTANVLESLGCAWLIIRWCGEKVTFRTVKEIAALICAATAVNACTAAIGAGTAAIESVAPFWGYWQNWWVSDGLGILLVTPLIVNWSALRPWPHFSWQQLAEFGLLMGVWCVLASLAFRVRPEASPFIVSPYLIFPLLALIALRLGPRGATTAMALLAVLAVTSSAVSIGPLPWSGVGPTNRLLAVQTFLACAAGTGLVLAASFAESQASERSAREEQARFQTLGNNLPNGMVYQIVRDFDGAMRFVYVSAGVERLNGVAAQAALKDPATFYGLVAEEDRARLAAAEEASARLMEPMEAVVRLRRPDGQLRWMRLAASPRRLADGRILWDGIQIDMTEHKQAETQSLQAGVAKDAALEALRASEERFRTLLEQAPFPLILTRGGRHIYVNRAFVRMLGLQSSEEAVGRPVEEYMSPPCRESSRERTRRRELGLPTPSELELEMLRADGAAIPVQVIVGEVQLPDGPCRMNCILDISERKRAEQALRESEARYRAITESASEAIITADGSGHIVGWNPGAEALFGYSETEARGQPLTLVVPTHRPARRPAGGGWLWRAAPRVAGRTLETPGRRKDGSEFPVELSLAAWEIAGHPLYTAIIRDITARVEAEAQRDASQEALRQAQKTESLGVLAGGVAHDFNNLLTAMLGQTSLALANLPPDSAARGPIEKAVNAALRAADLTRQMLAYSGRGRFAVQPLSLNALIEQNLSLLEVAIPKHVRVRRELADPLPLIRADAGQMQQVLMNLIINAAEAISTRPGTVTIGTGTIEITERDARLWRCATSVPAAGRYVMLQVADDGCGMSPETLARIFDPFFSTKFTGRGLGLAAVLGIVSGHQGGLRVDSQPGAGTTFQLAFPAAADEEQTANAPVAAPTAAPEGANHACVLVIDDEAPVREALVDILEASGLRVLTAEDGAAGVALYAGQAAEIGLIVLDLSMPGQSGEETFKQLRALNPQVRILVSSGYDGSEVAARFTGLSFTGFLQKPYSRETLTQAVWLHLPGCR